MVLLFFEGSLGDEHWEVAVLNIKFFDLGVEEPLDFLPDVERSWSQDVASRDVIVVNQISLGDDL